VREPSSIATDQRVAESQQPIHDASGVHEFRGEDEQRNGEQQVARVHAIQKLLRGRPHVEPGQPQVEHRAPDHRVPDRQPEQAQGDDRHHGEREWARRIHRPELAFVGSAASGSSPRSRCDSSHR
jgi:hypothetical protein